MEQHAETLDYRIPPPPGRSEQGGFERHVNDIDHGRRERQGRQIKHERLLALHAEARRIDEESGLTQHDASFLPRMNRNPRSRSLKIACDGFGSRERAIDDTYLLDAGIGKSCNDGARRAPGA